MDLDNLMNKMDWFTGPRTVIVVLLLGIIVLTNRTYFRETKSLYPDRWTALKFKGKYTLSNDTSLYRFLLRSPREYIDIPIGHSIRVKVTINGREEIRNYTPVNPSHCQGHFDLIVKTYKSGHVSKVFQQLQPGDKLDFKGPVGDFNYVEENNHVTQLGLVAGGSGITPIFQVLHEVVAHPETLQRVSLVYANETEDDILLKDEIDQMARENENFEVHYILHYPSEEWHENVGYITKEEMEKYLPAYADNHQLLICGPPKMTNIVIKYARELGWNSGSQKSKGEDKVFVF